MTCARCGEEVTSAAAWHQVVGFEQKRNQGGTNAVALRKRTGKVLCNACVSVLKSEANGTAPIPGQSSLI